MGDMPGGRDVLIYAIEHSQGSAYWHCRLTFQLAQLHADPRVQDYQSAHHVLQTGADYAFLQQAFYTRSLFILSKIMLFLCEKRFSEANPLLQQISPDIEHWVANYQVIYRKLSQKIQYILSCRVCWEPPLPGSRRSTCKCITWSSRCAIT